MSKIQKTDHFYLIDGSGYIFRAYYALPPLTRKSDGLPTGAVSGFCSMLFKLLEDSKSKENLQKPSHFAVIFDSARKTFRNEIYKDYKANRAEAPDDLAPQFDYIRKSVLAFNLPSVELTNYEADDLIATYTNMILKVGAKVTIVSSDKDLMQLYKKGVRIYDPMKNKFINDEDVQKKFGVTADKVIDVQALAGDSSDNVPGVPGIGVKTAAELINKYGDLETLLKSASEIKQNKRRETLLENRDKALISKKLVTLKNDAPIEKNPEEFQLKQINKEKLYKFLREMEFNRLLSSAISTYGEPNFEDKKKDTKIIEVQEKISNKNYFLINDIKEIDDWIKEAEEVGELAVDTETSSLDPHQADLIGISLSSKIGKACYIPINHNTEKNINKDLVLKKLRPLLEDPSIKKIGQNIKFDFIVLLKQGIKITSMEDTMLMSYVLDAGKNRHNMDTLSEIHLGHKTIAFKDLVGTGKKEINFSEVDLEKAKNYAAEDADITYRLYKKFYKSLKDEKMINVYELFEKPMITILANMEIEGIKIDNKFLKILSSNFEKKILKIQKEVFKISKKEFNIASPKQLGEVLFEKLNLPGGKKNKSGGFQTGADILEDLSAKGFEIASYLLEWRKMSKLKSTYSDSLMLHINNFTGRVHTSFNLAGTSTGRLSSSDPNLQNIPIRDTEGKKIRETFIAKEGAELLSLDYNQIELRLLAHIADVKGLKEAFKNNIDIHSSTASQIFKVALEKVDTALRRKAKAINFGIIYGISAFGLSRNLKIARTEAQEFIDDYFKQFPEIRDYMNTTVETARKTGFVTTLFNRKIHLPNIGTKGPIGGFAERAAINAPIQGSASDIIKRAMIKIHEFLKSSKLDAHLLLQVHDELIFETNKDAINIIQKRASEIMEQATLPYLDLDVPLKVEGGHAINWYLAH